MSSASVEGPPADLSPDAQLAARAARVGAAAALAVGRDRLDVAAKAGPVDLVTAADRAAEDAIAVLLRDERPEDGIVGEEAARAAGARRWVVDGLDGTFNYVSGIPQWCTALALAAGDEVLAAAVCDPLRDELFVAGRGEGARLDGRPLAVRAGRTLAQAAVATFLRQDKAADRGALLAALVDAAGIVRTGGAGTLELAWVAAGRVDGWAQPNVDPWDWLPGRLLVEEAGGTTAVLDGEPRWHLAGAAALVDELTRWARALAPSR
jgi:myo-inositol-1(or 4)-monophosphatase